MIKKYSFALNLLLLSSFALAESPPQTKKTPLKKTTAPVAKICTPSGVAPPIVGPGYSDPKFCCKDNIIIIDKEACERTGLVGFAGICAPCGNNICDTQWEDKCNCPEDCLNPAPVTLQGSSSSSSSSIKK
ncbi:MAG: hypothetical protein R3A80_10395 [Bdellovibrionota bacterium]